MSRVGVFVCHCGENIARTVDCVAVAEAARHLPGVRFATEYRYMCSDPGQNQIREQCSWVHEDRDAATAKAIDLVRMMVEKVKRSEDLFPIRVPISRRALVVGGGIAGIQAALDLANAGIPVVLLEREPSIGGHMSQLSETFPTLDCSQCILTPRMVEVAQHPQITLHSYSEVEEVKGYIGNFRVTIRKKARYVDITKCTGCGICQQKCPVKKLPSAFDAGLGKRAAIYIPFPQAVPNKPVIDRENCIYFKNGKCGACKKLCGPGAVDFTQTDELVTEEVGAVILATGYSLYSIGPQDDGLRGYPEYGHGRIPDVIDGLQFERLASASGPTGGQIRRPSDGKVPQTVVFLQCIGSRDKSRGIEYCSKICCMYTAKHALLYRHKVHDGQAIVFYMDVRGGGPGGDQPLEVPAFHPDREAAVQRANRSAVSPAGLRDGRRRDPRLGLPSRRLPLHQRKLRRTSAMDPVPRASGLRWARPRARPFLVGLGRGRGEVRRGREDGDRGRAFGRTVPGIRALRGAAAAPKHVPLESPSAR